jgi:hypothetical protein
MVIESQLRFMQPRTSITGKFSAVDPIWPGIRLDRHARTDCQS